MSIWIGTWVPMVAATSKASTNTDAAYPFTNALDLNRNTTWRATASGSPTSFTGTVDLGSAIATGGFMLHCRDYGSSAQFTLAWSDNNTDWTNYEVGVDIIDYLMFGEYTGDEITHRYHRVSVSAASNAALPKVGAFAVLKTYEIATNPQSPLSDSILVAGDSFVTPDGGIMARNVSGNQYRKFERSYLLTSSAQLTAFQDAFVDSLAQQYPICLQENLDDPIMCRFDIRELRWDTIAAGIYRVTIPFVEVPYIQGLAGY